eukprot:TRINITY_DN146_c0_g1_i2.p1 TRINITY_DN146_c0_g1~~TRINITY_DN146_c0_g1_i2.p1  ORF type:complete len:317 (+),score=97.69 TRINITY_DN146_c0_g1_i2:102-953(+)
MRAPSSLLFVCVLVSSLLSVAYGQGVYRIGASANPATVTPQSITRITAIADDMYARWMTLDAQCDPRAVFAVAYLYMTANAKKLVVENYFDDGNKMVDFVSTFADRYISAFDAWDHGDQSTVSLPWAVYFTFLESNRSDVTQDITIGMNAHINYDLAIAAFEKGYAAPQWRNDYFRINDLMAMVDANVTLALGRYDAQFYNTDFVSQTYFFASIEFVTSWRSNAYLQAKTYALALTSLALRTLKSANEVSYATAGQTMAIPYPYRTDVQRVPYCMANHHPLIV